MGWIIFILIIFMIGAVITIFRLIEENTKLENKLNDIKDIDLVIKTQNGILIDTINEIQEQCKEGLDNRGTTFIQVIHILREIKELAQTNKLTSQKPN